MPFSSGQRFSSIVPSCTPTVCYTNLYHDFKITPVIEGHRGVSLLQTASNSASTCRFSYGSYLVWKELGGFTQDALVPLGLYGMQLALNWAWTPIFFGAHNIKLAMIELVMLTGTVAATMVSWYPISRTATLLMVPYLAWLCLANSLNYCIWRDNPDPKKDD
uniref:Translocator protein n=1 Tax=Cyprinus carpio carpio TaxID=630221 RepID=A0A9J7YYM0_CYPCA